MRITSWVYEEASVRTQTVVRVQYYCHVHGDFPSKRTATDVRIQQAAIKYLPLSHSSLASIVFALQFRSTVYFFMIYAVIPDTGVLRRCHKVRAAQWLVNRGKRRASSGGPTSVLRGLF